MNKAVENRATINLMLTFRFGLSIIRGTNINHFWRNYCSRILGIDFQVNKAVENRATIDLMLMH